MLEPCWWIVAKLVAIYSCYNVGFVYFRKADINIIHNEQPHYG